MPKFPISILRFVGRLFLASTFAIAVPPKIVKYPYVLNSIVARGIPENYANLLLVSAICILVIGSVSVILIQESIIGPLLLLVFLVPTTIIFHLKPFQSQPFFMNMGLIGGLLLALANSRSLSIERNTITIGSLIDFIYKTLSKLLR